MLRVERTAERNLPGVQSTPVIDRGRGVRTGGRLPHVGHSARSCRIGVVSLAPDRHDQRPVCSSDRLSFVSFGLDTCSCALCHRLTCSSFMLSGVRNRIARRIDACSASRRIISAEVTGSECGSRPRSALMVMWGESPDRRDNDRCARQIDRRGSLWSGHTVRDHALEETIAEAPAETAR
jgi:hypothetical protein